MSRSKDYHKELIEAFKDPVEAAAYLNSAFREAMDESYESQALLLKAFRNVVEANSKCFKPSA
ncbi:MAG: hypothetical protein JSR58_00310 [Verrucomicrobia bacterium]|nr:hypothetical protein [Verrucomicrobiota bacterium]